MIHCSFAHHLHRPTRPTKPTHNPHITTISQFSMFLGFHKLKDEVHIANTQIRFVE